MTSDSKSGQEVLIVTGFLTRVSASGELAETQILNAIESLMSILGDIEPLCRRRANSVPLMSFDVVRIEKGEANAGQCIHCGRWVTNVNQADAILGLLAGTQDSSGRFLCSECELIQSGDLQLDGE